MSDSPKVPARYLANDPSASPVENLVRSPTVTSGALSIIQAWADSKLAERTKAKTLYINNLTDAAKAFEGFRRQIDQLDDLDNILAEDQSVRDEGRSVAEHQRQLAARQRKRELAEQDYKDKLAIEKNEALVARANDETIIAQRNRDAASTISQTEIETEKLKSLKRRHEVARDEAVEDSKAFLADLARILKKEDNKEDDKQATPQPQADRAQLDKAVAVIEDEISKQRQRGASEETIDVLRVGLSQLYTLRSEL